MFCGTALLTAQKCNILTSQITIRNGTGPDSIVYDVDRVEKSWISYQTFDGMNRQVSVNGST